MKKNMQLSINIPYKFNWGTEKPLSNQEVTKNLILKAVNQHFPQGLNQSEGRIVGELVEKLDDAVDGGFDSIEVSHAENEMLIKCFSDARFSVDVIRTVNMLRDELNKLLK